MLGDSFKCNSGVADVIDLSSTPEAQARLPAPALRAASTQAPTSQQTQVSHVPAAGPTATNTRVTSAGPTTADVHVSSAGPASKQAHLGSAGPTPVVKAPVVGPSVQDGQVLDTAAQQGPNTKPGPQSLATHRSRTPGSKAVTVSSEGTSAIDITGEVWTG